MRRALQAISIVLCIAWTAAADAEAPFEVGQQWTYAHSGPRLGSTEPDPVDGQRLAQVIRTDPNSGLWIIEERYTNDPDTIGRAHVDPNRRVVAIEIEGKQAPPALLRYDPPIPYEAPELAVGQTATIESTLRMDSPALAMPITMEFKRLADETIETDARLFEACRHYQITTHATLDIKIGKIDSVEHRHRWLHDRANGLVKETYRKEAVKFLTWSRPAYDASSVLTAFSVEAIAERPATGADPNGSPAVDARGRHSSHRSPAEIALIVVAIALAVTGFLFLRRKSARPGAERPQK